MSKKLKNSCARCEVAEACKYTFGKFWNDKSHGGKGCNHQPGDREWGDNQLKAAHNTRERSSEDFKQSTWRFT